MKKNFLLISIIIILVVLIIFFSYTRIFLKYKNKYFIEKNDVTLAKELKNSPFKIEKITLYSSAYGKNKNENFQKANWILDIYQYTDIALYVNCSSAIKNLSISNFKSDSGKLYYLDSTKFGTGEFINNYEIQKDFNFTVLNDSNHENLINYNTPIFFADGSNPITLKFINIVKNNFIIENNQKLKFDGSLLEKTSINLETLKKQISFDINIVDYNNDNYGTTINLNIPIKNESSTILNGNILEEKTNQNIILLKNRVHN